MSKKVVGYIYKVDEKTWVVDKRPHLKACCVSKEEQLRLEGDFSSCKEGIVYTFVGIESAEGTLTNVSWSEKKSFPTFSLLILSVIALLFIRRALKL